MRTLQVISPRITGSRSRLVKIMAPPSSRRKSDRNAKKKGRVKRPFRIDCAVRHARRELPQERPGPRSKPRASGRGSAAAGARRQRPEPRAAAGVRRRDRRRRAALGAQVGDDVDAVLRLLQADEGHLGAVDVGPRRLEELVDLRRSPRPAAWRRSPSWPANRRSRRGCPACGPPRPRGSGRCSSGRRCRGCGRTCTCRRPPAPAATSAVGSTVPQSGGTSAASAAARGLFLHLDRVAGLLAGSLAEDDRRKALPGRR